MAQAITEQDKVHEQWYKEAGQMTLAKLPAFIGHLMNDYVHDYGTVCHAIAACAVAVAFAGAERHGITGFQGGAVMWEFMEHWNGVKFPAWLLRGDDMLYPQYRRRFTTINRDTWKWLQEEAKSRLDKEPPDQVHPDVWAHWESVAAGEVPFGYGVRDDT